jgi:hypothetical protein
MKFLALIALFLSTVTAQAAVVGECGDLNNLENLVEPWEQNTKSFYNGQVRIALIDTGGEPVCCSTHLVIMVPRNDEMGGSQCFVFSQEKYTSEGEAPSYMGFQGIDFQKIKSSYDPAKGLSLSIPYSTYIDGIDSDSGMGKILINLSSAMPVRLVK